MNPILNRFATLAALVCLAGCGGGSRDDLPRQEVTGSVTLDGQPLADGMITFEPVDPSAGHPASGTIAAGSYEIGDDAGPTPGSYIVRITAAEATTQLSAAEAMELGAVPKDEVVKSTIPARYNAQSELRAEVTEDGPNTFDFTLAKS